METEILRKNIEDIIAYCDDVFDICKDDMHISGTVEAVNAYLTKLSNIRISANVCKLAIERLEDGNQRIEE